MSYSPSQVFDYYYDSYYNYNKPLRKKVEPVKTLPKKEKFYLFLLAGQSNMAGRGEIEEEDLIIHPRVLALNMYSEWVPAVAPIHFDRETAGVCLAKSFAVALAEADTSITIGLIPAACGNSAISSWGVGGFNKSTKNYPFDDAMRMVKRAMKDGTLKGILWHQGESDSKPGLAEKYEERLANVFYSFRGCLQDLSIPIIMGQMGRFKEKSWDESKFLVDKAQKNVAKKMENVYFVNSKGLTSKLDRVHFDSESLRIFGRRYADVYLKNEWKERKK